MPYSLSKTSRCQFDGVRFQTPIVRIRTYLDWEKASASGCFGARDFLFLSKSKTFSAFGKTNVLKQEVLKLPQQRRIF